MVLGDGKQGESVLLSFKTQAPCRSRSIKSDSNGGMKTFFVGRQAEGMKQRHSVVLCRPSKQSKSCTLRTLTGFGFRLTEMPNLVLFSLVP